MDIARAQDAEIGDGTTTVTLLAAELLRLAKPFVEDGVHPQIIIRVRKGNSKWWSCDPHEIAVLQGYRKAVQLAVDRLNVISVKFDDDPIARRALLEKCAKTSLNSKLIARYQVCRVHLTYLSQYGAGALFCLFIARRTFLRP